MARKGGGERAQRANHQYRAGAPGVKERAKWPGRAATVSRRPLPEVTRRWMTLALVALVLGAILVAVLR